MYRYSYYTCNDTGRHEAYHEIVLRLPCRELSYSVLVRTGMTFPPRNSAVYVGILVAFVILRIHSKMFILLCDEYYWYKSAKQCEHECFCRAVRNVTRWSMHDQKSCALLCIPIAYHMDNSSTTLLKTVCSNTPPLHPPNKYNAAQEPQNADQKALLIHGTLPRAVNLAACTRYLRARESQNTRSWLPRLWCTCIETTYDKMSSSNRG